MQCCGKLSKEDLFEIKITPPSASHMQIVKKRWDRIAKPLDGLGEFETIGCRIGAILEDESLNISKRIVLMLCADNGIIEEGVSQSGSDVTKSVAEWMGQGISSVCKMAKVAKADTEAFDFGMKDVTEEIPGVRNFRIAAGTKNFRKERAMTEEECLQAIAQGMELVREKKEEGYRLIATGEMGIGNTTTSAALTAALLQKKAEEVVSRGAGLSDDGLTKKKQVIQEAMNHYQLYQADAFTVLCTVGGFDLAGMVGIYLGGAMYHIPIVLDGIISCAAALCAERICPGVKEYMIASHKGKEAGIPFLLEELGLKAVIDGELKLGEGTGAVMLFPLLDTAFSLYYDALDFEETKVTAYERYQ